MWKSPVSAAEMSHGWFLGFAPEKSPSDLAFYWCLATVPLQPTAWPGFPPWLGPHSSQLRAALRHWLFHSLLPRVYLTGVNNLALLSPWQGSGDAGCPLPSQRPSSLHVGKQDQFLLCFTVRDGAGTAGCSTCLGAGSRRDWKEFSRGHGTKLTIFVFPTAFRWNISWAMSSSVCETQGAGQMAQPCGLHVTSSSPYPNLSSPRPWCPHSLQPS